MAQSYYPPRPFEINPSLNPIPFPPSQPAISSSPAIPMYPPPTSAVNYEASAFQQPYDPHYLLHQPNPAAAMPMVLANPEQQKIHTLFVSGLPDDVKAREIHNLFRRRHGFDSCQLKYTGRGNQVVAFATFFNHHSAMVAMGALNGVNFDPQSGATLHVELARSNSRTNRPRGGGAYAIIDKRVKATNEEHETWSNDGDGGSDEPSGTDNDYSSNKGALAAVQSGETEANPENSQAAPKEQSEKPLSGEILPCSTLFIANLGPTCTEEELKQVLSQYSGFHTLMIRGRGGMPVAFADFEDVESSTEAMNNLQGTLLGSSDRGGLHLEYARSKMRKS